MGLGLALGEQISPARNLQADIQKHGESYTSCIQAYLEQAISASNHYDSSTQEAVNAGAQSVRQCLQIYSDEEDHSLRRTNLVKCVLKSVGSLNLFTLCISF